jgi:hypothetical protein
VSDSLIRYKTLDNQRITINSVNAKYISEYLLAKDADGNQTVQNVELPKYKPAVWLSLAGGYSVMAGKLEKTGDRNLDALNQRFINGFTFGGTLEYFFKWKPENNSNFGIMLNFIYTNNTGSAQNIQVSDMGIVDYFHETLSKINIMPACVWVSEFEKMRISAQVGLGAIHIIDDMIIDNMNINVSTTVFGTYLGCEYLYKLSKKDALGIGFNLISGTFDKLTSKYVTLEYSEKRSASSLNLMLVYKHQLNN